MNAHPPAEWAAFVSLAVGIHGTYSAVWFVLVDAHRSDFPRLWQTAVNARHDIDWAVASVLHLADGFVIDAELTLRHAALTSAALLALILPTAAPKGATHA